MCEIMAMYRQANEGLETEIITVRKYPNGKFYNQYGEYGCIAGGFESMDEAEKMVLKHRPGAKRI